MLGNFSTIELHPKPEKHFLSRPHKVQTMKKKIGEPDYVTNTLAFKQNFRMLENRKQE
jgi:hypothetical protein